MTDSELSATLARCDAMPCKCLVCTLYATRLYPDTIKAPARKRTPRGQSLKAYMMKENSGTHND